MYFRDEDGRVRRVPTNWTSADPGDPFMAIAAGRCHFRTEDLLRLAELVGRLKGGVV